MYWRREGEREGGGGDTVNKDSQDHFIEIFFENDETSQKLFKKYAEECPLISECLHVPLNLITALEIFCSNVILPLPERATEMYEIYICEDAGVQNFASITASAEFPSLNNLSQPFDDLFELAYDIPAKILVW